MQDYQQRKQARIDRFRDRADRLRGEAQAAETTARQRAEMIPFGQPILIGHHSERRDRNFRDKIHNGFMKAHELGAKADTLERRADAAESNHAISSDDPDAPAAIEERIAKLEADQGRDKAINVAIRKAQKARGGAVDDTAAAVLAGLVDVGTITGDEAVKLARDFVMFPYHGLGIPSYVLTNRSANIRRLKDRIGALANRPTETTEEAHGEIVIRQNAEAGRTQIVFPGKPPDATRALLKSWGFRWSPTEGAWQRQISDRALWIARDLIGKVATA